MKNEIFFQLFKQFIGRLRGSEKMEDDFELFENIDPLKGRYTMVVISDKNWKRCFWLDTPVTLEVFQRLKNEGHTVILKGCGNMVYGYRIFDDTIFMDSHFAQIPPKDADLIEVSSFSDENNTLSGWSRGYGEMLGNLGASFGHAIGLFSH